MPKISKLLDIFYLFKDNVFTNIKLFFEETKNKVYLFVMLVINLVNWLIARSVKLQIGEEQIALHYNVDFGIDYYGDVKYIFIIPLLGLAVIVINIIIYLILINIKSSFFISHILFITAILVNIILIAAGISIYIINFR